LLSAWFRQQVSYRSDLSADAHEGYGDIAVARPPMETRAFDT